MPRSIRKQQLITIQSTSFFSVIFSCLERAFPIYRQNLSRPPVAENENIECSAALLILVTALESHVNRLMYFDNKGLSTDDTLLSKLEKFLPQRQNATLLRQIEEVTVCRDAIVHSHVWVVTRRHDANRNVIKQTYKPATITKFRKKLERNALKSLPVSKRLRLNLIPTNVDFVDLAKSLVAALHLLRKLEKKYGNPIAYVSPFPYEPRAAKTFLLSIRDNTWEGWVGGMIRLLHPCHRKELEHRFRFTIVRHTTSLVREGLLPRGNSYTLPHGGPTIEVRL